MNAILFLLLVVFLASFCVLSLEEEFRIESVRVNFTHQQIQTRPNRQSNRVILAEKIRSIGWVKLTAIVVAVYILLVLFLVALLSLFDEV